MVESGNHQSLLAAGGVYYHMVTRQQLGGDERKSAASLLLDSEGLEDPATDTEDGVRSRGSGPQRGGRDSNDEESTYHNVSSEYSQQ